MSQETLPNTGEVPVINELVTQTSALPYDHYWQAVSEFYTEHGDPETARVATHDQQNLQKLGANLLDPKNTWLTRTREVAASDVAEEWYLHLGPLNSLQGAKDELTVGFVRLWEAARGARKAEHDIPSAFSQAAMEILSTRDQGMASEQLNRMADDPAKAQPAILAGNVILDYVRSVPLAERTKQHVTFLGVAQQLNEALFQRVEEKGEWGYHDRALASEALKFQHEAKFEALITERQTGIINDEQYKERFNAALYTQVSQTLGLARYNRMTAGALHEQYFTMLARYATTSWREESQYLVRAATLRQDAPHDGFGPMKLPMISFDATVSDIKGRTPEQLIQLKMPGAPQATYEKGIIVFDDLLASDDPTEGQREIVAGMTQLQGLIAEILGVPYKGDIDTVIDHVRVLDHRLQLPLSHEQIMEPALSGY